MARRFIAVFYPECKISNTLVEGKVGEIPFKATGKQILDMGWQMVYAKDKKEKKEKEDEQQMPEFVVGEKGNHQPFIHQGKTTPPKYYTEATLLRAMETAGRQVEDEELREALKTNGIGRPSTRANIIETLFKRKYIERRKKNIIATQTGIDLIDTIEDELLKSPELTGEWEFKLRKIEKGEYESTEFKSELIEMVTALVKKVVYSKGKIIGIQEDVVKSKEREKVISSIENYHCPKCKSPLIKGKTAYGCSDYKQCDFKIPFVLFGKKLTDKQVFDLIQKGKTNKIKGFSENEFNLSEGYLCLDENKEVILVDKLKKITQNEGLLPL